MTKIVFDLLIFLLFISVVNCLTHWKVTESGRIETQEDTVFTLLRPYDLAAFLKQSNRLERLNVLKDLLASKEFASKKDLTQSIFFFYYKFVYFKSI
jgi:hypothetical protein